MLNKDQYNQDEYNDYYRQESQGAEIRGTNSDNGSKSKIILLLGLIALAVAGFFGFKFLNSSNTDVQSTKEMTTTTQEESEAVNNSEKESTMQAQNVQDAVSQELQKSTGSTNNMSPEQIAQIVAAVMSQMNQENQTSTGTSAVNKTIPADDSDLMNALSQTHVDDVDSTPIAKDYENVEPHTDTQIKNDTQEVDTYNKVTVQEGSGSDNLSTLADQINTVMSEDEPKENVAKEYTQAIKKEVVTRSNEMRIIVVKKGDTLGKIAQRAYGNVMDYKKIYDANPEILKRPDRIYIGQKLRIPK